jgi:pimeloyl-ACP methyl ester carboxylesterase
MLKQFSIWSMNVQRGRRLGSSTGFAAITTTTLARPMPTFVHAGQRLAYEVYGEGPRNVVLLPGLLLPSRMHEPLARDLANRGNRVITLDLLGHGESDKPRDMWRYSIPIFGRETIALLDHLELDEAVIGGTSLGANTALEAVSLAPTRVRGMVIEMPVLDNALLACAIAFTPLLIGLTFGEPITGPVASILRRVPRVFGHYPDVFLDWVSREPGPSAAVLQGIFFGRTAPPREERKTFEAPAIVLGHPRDFIHPFSDAKMLAEELPNGRLLEANSLYELRLRPRRLTGEIASFIHECWKPRPRAAQRRRRAAS